MEKAVLKTLAYADIFDYPMKAWEVHRWLIGRRATLRQVERSLRKLNKEFRAKHKGDYYFLAGRVGLVRKRLERETQSKIFFRQATIVGNLLRVIPGILLVGVSGDLAMENARKESDIDLFIICEKDRLWVSRLLVLITLGLLGKRRVKGQKKNVSGVFCVNLLLEEDQIAQIKKDIYTAHEILQMKVLWQRRDIYSRFLIENGWAFRYLPNWKGVKTQSLGVKAPAEGPLLRRDELRLGQRRRTHDLKPKSVNRLVFFWVMNLAEKLARRFQLWYMCKPQGDERISERALYFHPFDYRKSALNAYHKKLARLSLSS